MIGCDLCPEWFHAACVGINLAEIGDIDNFEFVCPNCLAKQDPNPALTTTKQQSSSARDKKPTPPKVPEPAPSQVDDLDLMATEKLLIRKTSHQLKVPQVPQQAVQSEEGEEQPPIVEQFRGLQSLQE